MIDKPKIRSFFVAFFVAVTVCTMMSCNGKVLSGKPGSSGKTQELIVVASNAVYTHEMRSTVEEVFAAPQEVLNQPEPMFDVVRLSPSQFDGNTMFQAHRNVLMLEVSSENADKVYLEYDKWALPQVVVRIAATSAAKLDSLLRASQKRIVKEFYAQEYRRMAKVFADMPNVKVNDFVQKKYGLKMTFPNEFMVAKSEGSFSWIRKETKDFGLGVLIDIVPERFADNSDALLNWMDTTMKRNVPGSVDSSYMGTERRVDCISRKVDINGVEATEIRGLWRTFGDHMGGPYVSYTFASPKQGGRIMLIAYVYSPSYRSKSFSKRDLLMQVDGICRTTQLSE